jgi:phosphoribosylamine--glycine ligase
MCGSFRMGTTIEKVNIDKEAMKILVLGGGGREHALVWALRGAGELVCAPGNGGIAALARCEAVDVGDVAAVTKLVERERPELVVIGPEVPLAVGVVDALRERGVRAFGPTQAAAQLESSKAFAKDFMQRWGIPTAAYAVCRSVDGVRAALGGFAESVVVKADGLAAGKGVVMCGSHEEAVRAAEEMFGGALLGAVVESVVVEEMLTGPEVSFFSVCDGKTAKTLAFAQDHKRVGEGDTGPNTGGMGAYSTDELVAEEMAEWLRAKVAQRVVDGMAAEGTPFQGVLFTGLMMTQDGPKVLEFNTRFGDPETEAIVLRLETPLIEILEAAVEGRVGELEIRLKPGASACVIAASGGYPGKYQAGKVISGLGKARSGVEVFHAGTALKGNEVVTAGGRVLAVSAAGDDLREALEKVYGVVAGISFEGMQFRRDIGWRALGEGIPPPL